MKKLIMVLAAGVFALSACNNADNNDEAQTPPPAVVADPEPVPGSIILRAGDDMKFDQREIKVKAGDTVKLTLKHTGKAPKTAMGHNFVLLKSGVSVDDFIAKAVEAKDNDYIPAGTKDVIAHTRLIGGGESDHIEFVAPAKGTYTYICSFPAHAMIMNGKLIVE
ncbi:azurin [Taibaiella chishuiensis]|nr:azurin [Taibaiella chishuiensis]